MDDTHTPAAGPANDRGEADRGEAAPQISGGSTALDELAAVDPADAPESAERLAAELSVELDEVSPAGSPEKPSASQGRP